MHTEIQRRKTIPVWDPLVCDSYVGELSFANRPGGGLAATVWLPREKPLES